MAPARLGSYGGLTGDRDPNQNLRTPAQRFSRPLVFGRFKLIILSTRASSRLLNVSLPLREGGPAVPKCHQWEPCCRLGWRQSPAYWHDGEGYPPFVEQEFSRYLDCGRST